jgi:hypothetical protein
MEKANLEGVRWSWECPKEDCQHLNWIDDRDIAWDDTIPVITCEKCKERFEANYPNH